MPASSSRPDVARLAVPALWAACEATWLCLWSRPLFGVALAPDSGFTLPYPLLAAAMVAAAVVAAWVVPDGLARWPRSGLAVPVAVAGVVLTAGAVGSTSGEVTAGAWTVAVLAWARGAWMGTGEVGYRSLLTSAALGAGAFVGLFLAQASDDATFNASVGGAAWLSLLFLVGTAGLVAVVRERDIERRVLARPAARPTLAWMAVVGTPMLAVAALATVVAVVAGPVGDPVGEAAVDAVGGIRTAVEAVGAAVGGIFSGESGDDYVPTVDRVPVFEEERPQPAQDGTGWPIGRYLSLMLILLPVIGGAAWLVARLRPSWGGVLRPDRLPRGAGDDAERSSVFAASTLWGRILAFLRRLFGRLVPGARARSSAALAGGPAGRGGDVALPPVREQYRAVLAAAARWGVERASTETPREFQARLAQRLTETGDMGVLTDLYSDVRYGDRPATVESGEAQAAAAAARAVITAMGPEPGPPGGRRSRAGAGREHDGRETGVGDGRS